MHEVWLSTASISALLNALEIAKNEDGNDENNKMWDHLTELLQSFLTPDIRTGE